MPPATPAVIASRRRSNPGAVKKDWIASPAFGPLAMTAAGNPSRHCEPEAKQSRGRKEDWIASFSFERFAAGVNNDLADTFGNLVNRVLKFVTAKYGGVVPAAGQAGELEHSLTSRLAHHLANLKSYQDERSLRKAADEVRAIWSVANAYLVSGAPWSHVIKEPDRAAVVVRTSVNPLALAATVAWPFIPATAGRVLYALASNAGPPWPQSAAEALALIEGGRRIDVPPILFEKISAEWVETNRAKVAGMKRQESRTLAITLKEPQ